MIKFHYFYSIENNVFTLDNKWLYFHVLKIYQNLKIVYLFCQSRLSKTDEHRNADREGLMFYTFTPNQWIHTEQIKESVRLPLIVRDSSAFRESFKGSLNTGQN